MFLPFRKLAINLNVASLVRNLHAVRAMKRNGNPAGASLEDVQARNDNGQQLRDYIVRAVEEREANDPSIKSYCIRGADMHNSTRDPTETAPCISVRLFASTVASDEGYIETIHVHGDGSVRSNRA